MSAPYFTPVPQLVGIEITNRCNLACRHCFNRSGEGPIQELSSADLIYLFDQLQAMGVDSVRLSGGEPVLHPDFPAIVAAAARRGLQVSINTNGLYTSRIRRQLADLPIATFLVSLDGLQAANDTIRGAGVFARASDTIRWLRSLGRAVTISMHLSRSNVTDLEGVVAHAAELGTDVKFAPLRPLGRTETLMSDSILAPADLYAAVRSATHLRPTYPSVRILIDFDILRSTAPRSGPPSPARAGCPAGRSMLNVSYDGYVYPCAFLVTSRREFAAGHIREAPLLTLWREAPAFAPLRTLEKDAQCQGCFAYEQTCVGGCVAMAYYTTGRLDARDPTCFIEQIPPSAQGTTGGDNQLHD